MLWFEITKMLIAVKKFIVLFNYHSFRHTFVPYNTLSCALRIYFASTKRAGCCYA